MRVSPPRISAKADRAPRPPAGVPGADAHRQIGFILGAEVETILAGLGFEGRVAEHLAGARYRELDLAGLLLFSSRSWLARLQALHAAETGSYVAAFPLLRAAADDAAAAAAMLASAAGEWTEWATTGGIARLPEEHALEYALHPFRSAEQLARNPSLGLLYRVATTFTLPHFGAAVLLGANTSDQERLAVTFGDRDFHLGLAELALGLLAQLGREQLRLLVEASDRLGLQPFMAEAESLTERMDALIEREDRCHLVFIEAGGRERIAVEGFRRTAGAVPTRLIL